ncbi:SDR family NAD(P)-dependent oxidoreductase [Aliiruegeria lutimaris]|nr:SDR family oxidoreductase [Aliiruegeria lutimaris]
MSACLRTVVTGCSGALGDAVCHALLRRGDRVVGLDRTPSGRDGMSFLPFDLGEPESVTGAVRQANEQLGGIDALVHAAGVMWTSDFLDTTEADLRGHLDVNLIGAFRVVRDVARCMVEAEASGNGRGGRIVLVTSLHGRIGVQKRSAYAASKGALEALGRVAAAELAQHRIRVNMLAPGAVDGGMQPNPGSRAHWVEATPIHRVATTDEVGRAAALLTSDDASFITGQTIAIDGGVTNLRPFGLPSGV